MKVNEYMLSDVVRDLLTPDNVIHLWNNMLRDKRLAEVARRRDLPVVRLYRNTKDNLLRILESKDFLDCLWNDWFPGYNGDKEGFGSLVWLEEYGDERPAKLVSFPKDGDIWRRVVMTLLEVYCDANMDMYAQYSAMDIE